jgi:hypothetical protein
MEKTEEQITKEKEAVTKVIGAKSAMEAALRRIETLENALLRACEAGTNAAKYLPDNAYEYRGETSIRASFKEKFAKLAAVI